MSGRNATIDGIDVALFMYFTLNNSNIARIIGATTSQQPAMDHSGDELGKPKDTEDVPARGVANLVRESATEPYLMSSKRQWATKP
jgi:hypothetical protein